VVNVTFIFGTYPCTKPEEIKWGTWHIISPNLKVRGVQIEPVDSSNASACPKNGGAEIFWLSEQRLFVWDIAPQSTKWQGMLELRGGWLLCPPWLRLWASDQNALCHFLAFSLFFDSLWLQVDKVNFSCYSSPSRSSLIFFAWEQYKLAQVLNSKQISEWLC